MDRALTVLVAGVGMLLVLSFLVAFAVFRSPSQERLRREAELADAMRTLRRNLEALMEQMGKALLPAMQKLSVALADLASHWRDDELHWRDDEH